MALVIFNDLKKEILWAANFCCLLFFCGGRGIMAEAKGVVAGEPGFDQIYCDGDDVVESYLKCVYVTGYFLGRVF